MTLRDYANMVEERLNILLAEDKGIVEPLLSAMRYSVQAGGKRLRPSMLLAAVDMLGGDVKEALPFACAVEMLHTYSLIHDDLPAMDDDDLRRGKPTNHVVFGEGQAILAGDGLLNMAYEVMLESALLRPGDPRMVGAMSEIAAAAGPRGMVGGQSLDLRSEREGIKEERMLSDIHTKKTARMFIGPLRAACHLAGLGYEDMLPMTRFGLSYGLLFQATDDLLDALGDEQQVGKRLQKDEGKLTYIALYGVEETKARVAALATQAEDALTPYGDRAEIFRALVHDTVGRTM